MQTHSSLRITALNYPVNNFPLQIWVQFYWLRTYYASHCLADLRDLMIQVMSAPFFKRFNLFIYLRERACF